MATRKKTTAAAKKKTTTNRSRKTSAARKKASKKVAAKATTRKKTTRKKATAKKKVAKKKATRKVARKVAKKVSKKTATKKPVAKKSAKKKATRKKGAATNTKKTAKKTTKKKKATAKPARKKAATKKVARKSPIRKTSRKKPTAHRRPAAITPGYAPLTGPVPGIDPYEPGAREKYMSEKQRDHFKNILRAWKGELMQEVDRTMHHMKDEAANFPDPNDRATQESEFSLELRTRDRERKLIKKIDEAAATIDSGDYGYCESCGVEIGIRRLEARPTATQCIDCKTLDEIREKQMRA